MINWLIQATIALTTCLVYIFGNECTFMRVTKSPKVRLKHDKIYPLTPQGNHDQLCPHLVSLLPDHHPGHLRVVLWQLRLWRLRLGLCDGHLWGEQDGNLHREIGHRKTSEKYNTKHQRNTTQKTSGDQLSEPCGSRLWCRHLLGRGHHTLPRPPPQPHCSRDLLPSEKGG